MSGKIRGFFSRLKKSMGAGTRTRKVWIIGALIVLAAGGFGGYRYFSGNGQLTYLTSPVNKGAITDAVLATGTLEPVRKVGLSFKNVETISVLNVKAGDHVTTGQVLAEQDTRQFIASVAQAARDVAQSEANIKTSTMTRDKAKKTREQQKALLDAGVLSQDAMDTANDDYEKSELDLAAAEAQLENSRTRLSNAQDDLAATKLVAPFDGIASVVNGDVGQRSGGGSGSEVNAFITLISEELQMKTMVNEVDMGRISIGQDVEFSTNAYPNKVFRGKVLRISSEATTVSNVQFYQTTISVEDPDHQLYSGMSTAVSIIVSRKTDVTTASMMALTYAESYARSNAQAALGGSQSGTARTRGADSSGSGQAQTGVSGQEQTGRNQGGGSSDRRGGGANQNRRMVVVLENDQPVMKPVTVGINDGTNIEIVEGLNPGDKVVIGTNQTTTTPSTGTSTNNRTQQPGGQNRQGGGGPVIRAPGMGG
ncbi:MAG: efflux RND transporter periplasmic adaptor subunit [Firmicutes bacterium]|nr:efflux RND transporter periplasmic adaptor subunit [Bacillota bacterium]